MRSKVTKRVLSGILCILLIISYVPVFAVTYEVIASADTMDEKFSTVDLIENSLTRDNSGKITKIGSMPVGDFIHLARHLIY